MDTPSRLGKALSAHRKRTGLSVRKLALRAGVPHTTVFDLETGRQQYASPVTTLRLATAIGSSVEDVIADTPTAARIQRRSGAERSRRSADVRKRGAK